jgi:hypothetical protein
MPNLAKISELVLTKTVSDEADEVLEGVLFGATTLSITHNNTQLNDTQHNNE